MARVFYISVLLVIVVFIAGCITLGGGARSKTEIVSKDLIVIKSIDVFPGKQVQPEDTIIVRMEVENTGQYAAYLLVDKDSKGGDNNWNGDYLLMDHCSTLYNKYDETPKKDAEFQILSGVSCEKIYDGTDYTNPKIPLVKDSAGNEIALARDVNGIVTGEGSCYVRVAPQQSHTFQWTLKAPAATQIAQMTQRCTFKFQTAYASKAATNTYVYFADPLELAQRLYAKNELALAGDNIASYGPIAANFEPAEPQPIPARTNSDGSQGKWTVFLNLKNVGVGLAEVNGINLVLPGDVNTYVTNGVDQCMDGGSLSIADINDKLSLLDRNAIYGLMTLRDAFAQMLRDCNEPLLSSDPLCSENNLNVLKKYVNSDGTSTGLLCDDVRYKSFCDNTMTQLHQVVKPRLEDQRRLLQINSQASSRIPCTLTIPTGVTILTPFKFVTTANYTYKIRRDIEITTKPIREAVY